ncbi:J domain-containing protein [Sphingomonas sp.]|uniref:J domain-containing protein n=1 Tax=Sphingomonas sp. TaxID=28214 RepID=UPI002DD62140|nr:DnaJ domain-containing protein [Sphingomonas sp.]
MILKLLVAAVLAYGAWRLWHGFGRPMPGTPKPPPVVPLPAVLLADGEARRILGVAADADADMIRAAHRRLIASVHPDRGGSEELTRQVNAARDTLLRGE